MQFFLKNHTAKLLAEAVVIVYMAIIAFSAHVTGVHLLLFPELAALSHDALTRPRGKWATQPVLMILTPTLTAIVGLFFARHESYSASAVAVVAMSSLLLIKALRSAIAPAISAGVLPMVLDEKSWIYPLAIFAGLVVLVAAMSLWKRYGPPIGTPSAWEAEDSRVVDALEEPSHDRFWAVTLFGFVLVLGAAGELLGLHFLLFPPLVVMAYEVFGHPEVPGWMKRPALFPVVCFLTASIGVLACHLFQESFAGVALTMIVSLTILRIFKVHMPPALAVGILPFVMDAPNFWYPVSVTMGTIALTLYFLGYDHLRRTMEARRAELSAI
jgi:HPP family